MSILRRLTDTKIPCPAGPQDPPSPGHSPPGSPRGTGGGSSPRKEVKTKVICLGDSGVGKTSMLLTFTTGKFPRALPPTTGEVYSGSQKLEGKTVSYEMLDGLLKEDDPKLIEKLSHHGEAIFLLCFSINSHQSWRNLKAKWVIPLKEAHPVARSFVVGLKADLRDDVALVAQMERQGQAMINADIAAIYAKEIGAVGYLELSALTGKGLAVAFEDVFKVALLPTLRAQPLKPLPPVKPEAPPLPHLLPNQVGADIARMHERTAYADLRFIQDQWTMTAHTVIVAAGCSAFKNGLFAKICTFQKDRFNMLAVAFPPGLQPGFAAALLKYIYTGEWQDTYRQQLEAITHEINCQMEEILYLPEVRSQPPAEALTFVVQQKMSGRTALPRRGQKYTDSYTQYLTDSLVDMLLSETVPDVEFVLSDGAVKAHKVVCAVRNYRMKLLLANFTDLGVVHSCKLPEYGRSEFQMFLRFLYNGLNPASSLVSAQALLRVACEFKADALIVMLEEQLIKEMNLQGAASLLALAHECNAPHVRRHAVWLLATNFVEVAKMQSFASLKEELRSEVTKAQWPPVTYYAMLDRWREDDANWQREREVFVNSNTVAQEKCLVQ